MERYKLVLIAAAVLLVLVVLGILEKRRNEAALAKLQIRVNVNGIRGKSTATRLITAVLQEAGYRVVGKTTGTAARLFAWDSTEEEEIRRYPHGVSISEQMRVIRSAVQRGANALVCECMAVKPEYQRVYQHDIIKANLTVIVNVLEDHLDEMGPTTTQIAWAFADTIPYGGKVVIPDCEFSDYFRRVAEERGSQVYSTDDSQISREYLAQFDYRLFEHNCAVALAAAEALGIDRDTALRGMLKAAPDPGALRFYHVALPQGPFTVVNAFAANEPASSLEIWDLVKQEMPEHDLPVIVLNCRPDRVDRTHQFVRDFIPQMPPCTLITVGENTGSVSKAYRKGRFPNVREYLDFDGQTVEQIMPKLIPFLPGRVVICVGNIHGCGGPLLEAMVNLEKKRESSPVAAV